MDQTDKFALRKFAVYPHRYPAGESNANSYTVT